MRTSCRPFLPSGVSSPSPTEETGGLWVSGAAGLGFCEAQKGGRCIIARCFDHVSGNYCWVRTETYLLKESFPLAPTPLGKLMLRRGWALPLTLQSRAPWCLKVIDLGTGILWGQQGQGPGLGTESHPREDQAGTPPGIPKAPPAPLGLPFLMMTERDSAGFPGGSGPPLPEKRDEPPPHSPQALWNPSSSSLPPGLSYLMSESHSGSCHQELCCDSLADSFTTNTLKAPGAGTPGCRTAQEEKKNSPGLSSASLSPNPSSPGGLLQLS